MPPHGSSEPDTGMSIKIVDNIELQKLGAARQRVPGSGRCHRADQTRRLRRGRLFSALGG